MSVCRTTSFCKKASACFPQAVTLDGRKKSNTENGKEETKKGKEGGTEEVEKSTGEIMDLDLFYFLSMPSQLISFDALLYKTRLNEINKVSQCCLCWYQSSYLNSPSAEVMGVRHRSGHFQRIHPCPHFSLPWLLEQITVGRTIFSSDP